MNAPTIENVRRVLTPAMRLAVATTPSHPIFPGASRPCLRGLHHGATLNALVRHGLARHERNGAWDDTTVLTDFGYQVRDDLRARVDEKLAAHGFTRVPVAGLNQYRNPDDGGHCTRAGAMRRTGVKW